MKWIWVVLLVWVGAVQAQDKGNALLDLLIRKGTITPEEAAQVRADWDRQLATTIEKHNKTKVASWITEMKWSGDLRLRAEYGDNADQATTSDRWRYRYRLRFGLETKFQDWATVGLRLASGGEDPVGSNQSFQDSFSRKSIGVDQAYVALQPPGWDWLKVTGGKMANPIWQSNFSSPLLWDGDLMPEGMAEQFVWRFGDKKHHSLFANFGQFVLDELGSDANDPYLLDFQAGAQTKLGPVRLTAAGGYYQTFNLASMGVDSRSQPAGAATPAAQSTSPNRGNATRQPGGAGTPIFYLDDFQVLSAHAEAAIAVGDKPFLGTPAVITVSGQWAHNLANAYEDFAIGPDQTDGWSVQAAFGGNKNKGEWLLLYQYKYMEADAVWDAISDSDWGTGGTDRKGHIVKSSYNVRDWWQLSVAAIITEKISARPNSDQNTRGQRGENLLRLQLDTVFRF